MDPVPGADREWSFDPGWITLNNGSFGACPASVRRAEAGIRARLDAQPTRFLHAELAPRLRAAADAVAMPLGAAGRDLAFVENATAGINAVLRSRPLGVGSEILLLDQAYGAVRRTAEFVARERGARVVAARLPRPDCTPDAAVAAVEAALTTRTAIAVLDHVTSKEGLVLPIAAMVAACRRRGVPVLVDGAHAPGQVPVDLGAIGADWYAANLHKWFFAPTGTGILHAAPAAQAGLHPVAISHGLDGGFAAEFDWTGTRDFSAWLAAPEALRLHERMGGAALMARNAALVREGAARVARAIGTEVAPACLPGAMARVRLPARCGRTPADADAWRARLIEACIDVPVVAVGDILFLRLSAHAYTGLADFERFCERLLNVLGDRSLALS